MEKKILEELEEIQLCPKCSRDKSLGVEILVSICGHKLCRVCVQQLYTLNTESVCFNRSCSEILQKKDYSTQLFSDLSVHREILIRTELNKVYNKPREAFPPEKEGLLAYNEYLETIEEIVYNLLNRVNISEMKDKIKAYKEKFDRDIRFYSEHQEKEINKMQLQAIEEKQILEKRQNENLQMLVYQKEEIKKEKEDFINCLQTEALGSLKERIKIQDELKERKRNAEKTNQTQITKKICKSVPLDELVLFEYKSLQKGKMIDYTRSDIEISSNYKSAFLIRNAAILSSNSITNITGLNHSFHILRKIC